ncbi:hypothetical protein FIBSPDRAFT_931919 [Athelia psychrophila]|uniref:Uncharacterized protein n=1 Tax=Athelia psychrophila TaxID=1759441 RepID=A0A166JQE8_9AGAM|nr:hypothetical protein FIBSPDRAFT_931919 [Fibularhizoctonia sp. CBS 109695]
MPHAAIGRSGIKLDQVDDKASCSRSPLKFYHCNPQPAVRAAPSGLEVGIESAADERRVQEELINCQIAIPVGGWSKVEAIYCPASGGIGTASSLRCEPRGGGRRLVLPQDAASGYWDDNAWSRSRFTRCSSWVPGVAAAVAVDAVVVIVAVFAVDAVDAVVAWAQRLQWMRDATASESDGESLGESGNQGGTRAHVSSMLSAEPRSINACGWEGPELEDAQHPATQSHSLLGRSVTERARRHHHSCTGKWVAAAADDRSCLGALEQEQAVVSGACPANAQPPTNADDIYDRAQGCCGAPGPPRSPRQIAVSVRCNIVQPPRNAGPQIGLSLGSRLETVPVGLISGPRAPRRLASRRRWRGPWRWANGLMRMGVGRAEASLMRVIARAQTGRGHTNNCLIGTVLRSMDSDGRKEHVLLGPNSPKSSREFPTNHPSMSATATMTTTQTQPTKRRLSSRRGSVAASDPWGAHSTLNHNPRRSSSSTLTIVRVQHPSQIPQAPLNLREPPRRNHRRQGSASSIGSNSGPGDAGGGGGRMSFAFSSFGGRGGEKESQTPTSSRPESPTSPRPAPASTRPASPSRSRHAGTAYAQPRLSPEQLFDLARASTSPRPAPPTGTLHTAGGSTTPGAAGSPYAFGDTSPASFIPMAADVWLPFIDRPAEVAALLSCAPSSKLFSLLAQTFPSANAGASPPAPPSPTLSAHSHHSHQSQHSHSSSQSSYSARKPEIAASSLPAEPTAWTYEQLLAWLTQVPREGAPGAGADDALWVRRARQCIMGRSELIWERVKGALGVPPELDQDVEHEQETDEFTDDEEIGVGEKEEEGDVFEEWDSAGVGLDEQHSAHRRPSTSSVGAASSAGEITEHVSSPTTYSPPQSQYEGSDTFGAWDYNYEDDPDARMSLSIENIMAAPTTPGGDATAVSSPAGHHAHQHAHAHSPLSSLAVPTSLSHRHSPLAMGGIAEDAEDEDAAPKNEPPRDGEAEGYTTARPDPSGKFDSPPHGGTIQGLKISTSPSVSRGSAPSSPCVHPSHSPKNLLAGLPPLAGGPAGSSAGSRRAGGAAASGATTGSMGAYDPVGERGPGNPLFPSNFARLAVGPTLRANNPALRSPRSPPQPAYPFMRQLGMGAHAGAGMGMGAQGRGAPSWAEGWRGSEQEYAVTVGSGSSVAGCD